MTKDRLLKKGLVFGIIVLFVAASVVPTIIGLQVESPYQVAADVADVCESQENVVVTCYTFGFPGEPSQEIAMSLNETEFLYNRIKDLQIEISRDPLSDKTQQLQHEIITLADEHNLLPAGLSQDTLQSRLYPSWAIQNRRLRTLPLLPSRGSELFCTFVSTGSGALLPIIALPRLIPILMTPIPRLFVWWRAQEAVTSCGGLRSETGFIAYGQQKGIALGFWGIGFTFSLPPFMGVYGLIGFALFASVNAERIEYYPPNYPPEINAVYPLDGAKNIPVLTSELSFKLNDPEGDLMSYSVTTEPDIGASNGHLKPNGVYTVPVSGLEGLTEYAWYVEANDGNNWVDTSFTFTTEAVAPIVSDPSPLDGARNVPMPLTQLSFHLKDFQGDPMDYTVETSPDIGSGSGTGVGDGTYIVDVSGLDYSTEYIWHVDVTDGTHWTKKIFSFKTKALPGPWWNNNWSYRKEIIVNYAKVDGGFDNFPVLIKLESDDDLASNAQSDGDDIVFTDHSGAKLNHEIEFFKEENGELIAWVNVPNLTCDTILYMYYGNPSCNNQQNIEGTWHSSYKGVWHLDESPTDPAPQFRDSTGYGNDGTANNIELDDQVPGKIHKGIHLDYDDTDYIDCGTDSSMRITGDITISGWINCDTFQNDKAFYWVNTHPDDEFFNYVNPGVWLGYDRMVWHRGGSGYNILDDINSWPRNGWHYFVVTDDTSIVKLYIDSVFEKSHTSGSGSVGLYPLQIGACCAGNVMNMDAELDETRISNAARNSDWISTEYNNQNDPSSFLSFGPEETEQ